MQSEAVLAATGDMLLEKLLHTSLLEAGTSFLKEMCRGGFVGAGTETLNTLADYLVAGRDSRIREAYRSYLEAGKTAEEAKQLVCAAETQKILRGFLAGATLAGTASFLGRVLSKGKTGKTEIDKTETDKAVQVEEIEKVEGKGRIKGGEDSVDDIVKGVENGDILLSNNIQKGNYGEMKMDVYFKSQGYERISLDRVTDLNASTHQGIDGVYYNPDGHPPYIIGEAKYGSSRLLMLADGTPQMSDKWIIDRLENAVGEEIANDIKMEMILNPDNVGFTLVHVSSDGGIDITELIDGIEH